MARKTRNVFWLSIGVAIAATVFAPTTMARLPAVLEIEGSPVEGNLTMEQVKKEIMAAGRPRGWRMKEIAPGHLEAIIYVRAHMAKVDIKYNTKEYSIHYKDSDNLKYKEGKIHKAYNNWITNLDRDIQLELGY